MNEHAATSLSQRQINASRTAEAELSVAGAHFDLADLRTMRTRAHAAVRHLAHARDWAVAHELYLSLGDQDRAAQVRKELIV